jgi:predicted nucleic acid-binding protein
MELKVRLLGNRVSRRTAWRIAREQGWETTYDAEYLAVTHLQADALVTVDLTLAAKAKDVVPLASFRALADD